MKTQHTEASAPAAPRRGWRWGLHVLCFHMYEAPPGAPRRPQKARLKAEALLSNIASSISKRNNNIVRATRGQAHLAELL